ncbi:hypothetical protein MAR_014062 [Mya arenaria]|uniref:Uncharacterized protein n=1 Tax=Mya arenaria TaxID=6604 RepID=A0ABY7G5C0_MYAAR|nr:hypothetical protein MAR_014062 [Mya arenaria]
MKRHNAKNKRQTESKCSTRSNKTKTYYHSSKAEILRHNENSTGKENESSGLALEKRAESSTPYTANNSVHSKSGGQNVNESRFKGLNEKLFFRDAKKYPPFDFRTDYLDQKSQTIGIGENRKANAFSKEAPTIPNADARKKSAKHIRPETAPSDTFRERQLKQPSDQTELRYVNGCRPKTSYNETRKGRWTNMGTKKLSTGKEGMFGIEQVPLTHQHFGKQGKPSEKVMSNNQHKNKANSKIIMDMKSTDLSIQTLKRLLRDNPLQVAFEITSSEENLIDAVKQSAEQTEYLEVFLEVIARAFTCQSSTLTVLFEVLMKEHFFTTLQDYLLDTLSHFQDDSDSVKHAEKLTRAAINTFTIIWEQTSRSLLSYRQFSRVFTVTKQIIETPKLSKEIPKRVKDDCAEYSELKRLFERANKCKNTAQSNRPTISE